jgi:hypothetical protein
MLRQSSSLLMHLDLHPPISRSTPPLNGYDPWTDKKTRAKQQRVKPGIVRDRGYHNVKLESEQIAEFEHTPGRAKKSYRMIVLRKNLIEERGQLCLGTSVRYFFYVTNDPDLTAEQVVFHANERCNQENLIAQLKSGVNSLRGPLNKFVANWALMVMASLAWSLKAWLALSLSSSPECPDDADIDAIADADADAERNQILRMDLRPEFHAGPHADPLQGPPAHLQGIGLAVWLDLHVSRCRGSDVNSACRSHGAAAGC